MNESPYQYEEIMEAVKRVQNDLPAIVILAKDDGGTTYLRHNITGEDVAKMMRQAYCRPPNKES